MYPPLILKIKEGSFISGEVGGLLCNNIVFL